MSQFEDEPEDYWHPEDPVVEQIRNLRLRLSLMFSTDDPRGERNLLRGDDLEADLEYVWDRAGTLPVLELEVLAAGLAVARRRMMLA